MKELKIKRMSPTATLPTRATHGAAGYDLYADIPEAISIAPGAIEKIPTGIAIALEDSNLVALLYGRSGLSILHGITPANAVGVIDSDYRGEIVAVLLNRSDKPFTLSPQDRIAQLVLTPIVTPTLVECDELSETDRGTDGFGSSGR